jgi:transposase
MGASFPIIVIQEAGLDGFWIHRVLQAEGIESHVAMTVAPALLLGAALLFERRLAQTLLELHDVTSHRHNLMKQHRTSDLLSGVA